MEANPIQPGDWRVVQRDWDTPCWEWIRTAAFRGYCRARGGAQRDYVHRWAYRKWVGPIPEGLVIDHLCRNRSCVNPEHLEAVSVAVNTVRGGNAVKTHCKRGHPLDEENTWVSPSTGARRCRPCANLVRSLRAAA